MVPDRATHHYTSNKTTKIASSSGICKTMHNDGSYFLLFEKRELEKMENSFE